MVVSVRNEIPLRVDGASLVMSRLGMQAPMQMLWFVGARVERARLDRFADEIAAGPLGVRWVPSRAPGARPTWAARAVRPVVDVDDDVPVGHELSWADDTLSQLDEEDLRHGGGWRLSAALVTDGSTVVSLAVSHTLSDGQGVVAAADAAARHDRTHAVPVTDRPSLGADVDRPVTVVVVVPAATMDQIADRVGGTATGLSIAVVANIARAAAGTTDGGLAVGMPVSRRASGDATTGMQAEVATVRLPDQTGRYTDLRDIRRRSKAAYLDARSDTGGLTDVGALLFSVGDIPDAAAHTFGTPTVVVPRAQARRIPVGFPLDGDRLAALRTMNGPSTAFTVTSSAACTDHVLAEFDSWDIPVLRRWSTSPLGAPPSP